MYKDVLTPSFIIDKEKLDYNILNINEGRKILKKSIIGYSVAMGNAIAELKDKSDYVTLSNDEDGVNHFLKKLIKRM